MPKPEIDIRPARPADLEAIAHLLGDLDSFHQEFEPNLLLQGDPKIVPVERLQRYLDGEEHVVLVAPVDGEIAGFARLQIEDRPENRIFKACRAGVIHELAVSERYRRHGIGRALMEAAHAAARAAGVESLSLSHFAGNEVAGRFYDSMGYRPYMRNLIVQLS